MKLGGSRQDNEQGVTMSAITRRSVVQSIGAGLVITAVPALALATPEPLQAEVKKAFGDRPAKEGRIKLDLPTIAENGLSVPLTFEVESPMSEADHVKVVHLFAEGNPSPLVAAFHFTPMIPKAAAQIRVRLAQTQNVLAYAEMSNGEIFVVKREVKVTIGGCGG
jgi:sulfur-oxidizing protein SoxY